MISEKSKLELRARWCILLTPGLAHLQDDLTKASYFEKKKSVVYIKCLIIVIVNYKFKKTK